MEIWTPIDRNDFIKEAVYSSSLKGNRGPYHFHVYPKSDGTGHDERKTLVTDVLAKSIYQKNPKFKYISMGFYYTIIEKIRINVLIGQYLWRDILVIIKGANAYAYLTKDVTTFPFSDLDIMIYINPNLPDETFHTIKKELRTISLQTLSQYKRLLDHMFFVNGTNKFKESPYYKETKLFDDEEVAEFKKNYNEELEKLNTSKTRLILSPFQDDDIRNTCSRFSFLLTNSEQHEDSIVKVEVPHYDKCENIPMKKTPFFCSYNETIDFKRDGQELTGKFDLYRIRFNNLFVDFDDDGKVIKEEKVAADFIDVSIASKSDAELIDFWNTARCEHIRDPDIHSWRIMRDGVWESISCWLIMPNVETCVNDLYKMLNVYDCPESKKAKREIRYLALKALASKLS
jgi:hypothetical protein